MRTEWFRLLLRCCGGLPYSLLLFFCVCVCVCVCVWFFLALGVCGREEQVETVVWAAQAAWSRRLPAPALDPESTVERVRNELQPPRICALARV